MAKEEFSLTLEYGAMAPRINTQLSRQKLIFAKTEIYKYQKISESISMLNIHGFISQDVAGHMRFKLHKQVENHVKKFNNL